MRKPALQIRLEPILADEVRALARSRHTDVSAVLRGFIEDGLMRAGFPAYRDRAGMPRVEARLRELAHRNPPVLGGGYLAILRELNTGYADPQKPRQRSRLDWCIAQRFILPAGDQQYRLAAGEIHRRLCPSSCGWLGTGLDYATEDILEDSAELKR